MKNRFFIDKTELVNGKGAIKFGGWYEPSNLSKISFQVNVGGEDCTVEYKTIDRPDVLDVFKDMENVIGFEVLAEEVIKNNFKQIELCVKDGSETICLKEVGKQEFDEILDAQLFTYNIDNVEAKTKDDIVTYTVTGWAVLKDYNDEVIFDVKTSNGESIEAETTLRIRPDLITHRIADKEQINSGFIVKYSVSKGDSAGIIELTTKRSSVKRKIDVQAIVDAKENALEEAFKTYLKENLNFDTIKIVLSCIFKNGFEDLKTNFFTELASGNSPYRSWYLKNVPTEETLAEQRAHKFEKNSLFSIVVPLYNTPKKFLKEMIESVQAQTYSNWELCLVDGSDSEHAYVEKICARYIKDDARIVYKRLEKNLGISENTNAALEIATGDYIALFDHDDLLHPSVLHEYMKVIVEKDADFIYCDELTFVEKLENITVLHFKPDFAIDNLRSNNYICHFSVFKKTLLDKVGGFRKEFDGSQDHDLILRLTEQAKTICHVPKVLYFWRSHKGSVASDISSKTYAIEAGINAVKSHLDRMGIKGEVESSSFSPSMYRVKYELTSNPLISILIPTMDHVEDLSRCINSILKKSTYENYEIIVIENNSKEAETFAYYKELEKNPKIQVVTYEANGVFNYSAINNYGMKFAKGEHILLLNNDIEIITENWIEEMLMFSQREDVGAVGAKLYYPNETVQHAGVIVGAGGIAGHAHLMIERIDPGYMGRAMLQQDYSAVTAACLMMRRDVYDEVGGLDEGDFKVAFNDVDLCLKVRKAGYLVAWTPYAEAYHYESVSRGAEDTLEKQLRFQSEIEKFEEKWEDILENGDPYYNKNFSITKADFSV